MSDASEENPDSTQERQERLQRLEQIWLERFEEQPKLPTSALLTGAVAMALGFGAIMFFAFAWATQFQRSYTIGLAIFTTLSIGMGLTNRLLAKSWFRKVKAWNAERTQTEFEMEALKKTEDAGDSNRLKNSSKAE